MDQEIRNKLRNVVTQCRKLLEDAISQELEGKYGIFAKKDQVTADPDAKMAHLTDEEQTARKEILDHFAHIKARGFNPKEALDQLVREIAFTHLNRLCAYKMMEAREVYVGGQKFREAVSRGVNSNGVKFYLAEHPEEERLFNTGHQDVAYRHFLDWLGGLLSDEIGVLFNPCDPANRLYPRQKTLDEVLDLLNAGGIKAEEIELREEWSKIWSQDETIGWVYQYFTPKELRDAARDPKKGGSQAPRNSYELAFRNQFFTPRYVVEFLTDNTLGRIWYEMRKGDTKLKRHCRYMVRRPNEIFLTEGEQPLKDATVDRNDLSPEELVKLSVHIPHRPKKDPRELKILDPACGSGHFLLYCFDLLLTIYEEAYADADLGPALRKDYRRLEDLRRDLPRLILAHNLYGIDIDLRASQIAALALWLRCQRAYQEMGSRKERPKITRSNLVCAEPMPGEEHILKEFVGRLEPRLLAQLVETVFDKMKLAGEAGSLLKIEEDIRDAVVQARKQWLARPIAVQRRMFEPDNPDDERVMLQRRFDLSGITSAQFFEQAEARVVEALRDYAENDHNGRQLERRLFADDAVRGFAFVDLCHRRFDVVVMNPPFGSATASTAAVLDEDAASNLYPAFVLRALENCVGFVGAITDRTFFVQDSFKDYRRRILGSHWSLMVAVDLGWGVLDTADVQVAAYVVANRGISDHLFLDVREADEKPAVILSGFSDAKMPQVKVLTDSHFRHIPNHVFAYSLPQVILDMFVRERTLADIAVLPRGLGSNKAFRTYRVWFEIPRGSIGERRRWRTLCNGGDFSPFSREDAGVADWTLPDGTMLTASGYPDGFKAYDQKHAEIYFSPGLSFPKQSSVFNVAVLSADAIPTREGKAIIPHRNEDIWFLLAYLNSSLVRRIVESTTGLHKQSGSIGLLPVPQFSDTARSTLECLARRFAESQWKDLCFDETSRFFQRPKCVLQEAKTADHYALPYSAIDDCIFDDMKLDDKVRETLRCTPPDVPALFIPMKDDLLSFAVGCCFGRWSLNSGLAQEYALLDPIPGEPPAMLRQSDGEECPIAADGVLIDDSASARDIVTCVRNVIERLTLAEAAETFEMRFCHDVGVPDLRQFFRATSERGFWPMHIERYDKSRRKAPIYWLLQSSKRNYALWLYYHRLDKDQLFKALVNYVEPKIRLESSRLQALQSQKAAAGESGKEARRLAKEVERQEDFRSELRDFEDKLRRAANLGLEPDLNDGVVLNIAPLWELVPWKEAKTYWDDLMKGEYEWSSIGKQLREKGLVH